MPLDGLPEDITEIGFIHISLFMGEDGVGYAYGIEGVDDVAAVGYLTTVLDRVRDNNRYSWPEPDEDDHPCLGPVCPECGYEHNPDEED